MGFKKIKSKGYVKQNHGTNSKRVAALVTKLFTMGTLGLALFYSKEALVASESVDNNLARSLGSSIPVVEQKIQEGHKKKALCKMYGSFASALLFALVARRIDESIHTELV